MPDFRDLQQKIITFRDDRNWKDFHQPQTMLVSLWVEVGELAEHFQYLSDTAIETHLANNREAVADELVDVLFWVLLMCHELHISLETEFVRKMRKNLKGNPKKGYKPLAMSLPRTVQSLKEMTSLLQVFRDLRGFPEKPHPRAVLFKLFEEVGELARHFVKRTDDEFIEYVRKHHEAVTDEVVDIMMCVLLLFLVLEYDISVEFDRKMSKNAIKYPISK